MQALATHIWAIEDGQLHVLEGSWQAYVDWRSARQEAAADAAGARVVRISARRSAQRGGSASREKMQVRQRDVEEEIAGLEEQMEALSQRISAAGEAQDVDQCGPQAPVWKRWANSQVLWSEWETLSTALKTMPNLPTISPRW